MKLSEQLANTAANVASVEFTSAKSEIREHLNRIAQSGQRSTIMYPTTLIKKNRNLVVKWLQDEGFNVTYTSSQRDGDFLNISF